MSEVLTGTISGTVKISGDLIPRGIDGYSPTIDVEPIDGGTKIIINDISGTKTATINDGATGAQGVSGKDGKDGKDGVAATHSWSGTTLTVTSASGTSSANLKGEPGTDGISPTVSVSKSGKVTTVSITDKNGTKTAKINDGADGASGSNGKDGVSVTHSWNGTTLNITSASGTTSANLKGETGAAGSNGKDGTSVTVKSVSESSADGGSNVVTFSDGKTLTVKNGKTGTGAAGKDGKSAYQYAVDGGYTGTEAEFANLLANGGSGGSGVSSWNDLTGKPEGVGYTQKTVLLPETTLTFVENGFMFDPPTFIYEAGETYEVTWNGVVYTCQAVNAEGFIWIGNSLYSTGEEDTGEPFMSYYHNGEEGTHTVVYSADGNPATVKITHIGVHKIEPKYLGICHKTSGLAIPETTYDVPSDGANNYLGIFDLEPDFPIEEGNTYKVTYNGNSYSCVARSEPSLIGYASSLRNENSNEFMLHVGNGKILIMTEGIPTVTFKVETDQASKIDPKFLPDSVALLEKRIIFPERALIYDAVGEGYLLHGFVPQAGKSYEVTHNGKTYTVTAMGFPDSPYGACVAMGNGVAFGYPDTGETFVLAYICRVGSTVFMPLDGQDPVVKIASATSEQVMDKYLPGGVFWFDVNENDSNGITLTPRQLKTALDEGKQVIMRYHYVDDSMLPNEEYGAFAAIDYMHLDTLRYMTGRTDGVFVAGFSSPGTDGLVTKNDYVILSCDNYDFDKPFINGFAD